MRTVTIRYTVNSTNDKVPHAEEPRDRETITRGSGTAVGRVTGPLTATYPVDGIRRQPKLLHVEYGNLIYLCLRNLISKTRVSSLV
jgi:hypothetical protein